MTALLQLKFSELRSVGALPAPLAGLGPQLDKLRDELCDVDEKMLTGEIATPASKQPLGTGFISLPERMLADYEAARPASELGRMLTATKRLMSEVDCVLVLGDAEHLSGAQAVMQACCQPYFNHLTRGERGSRPRVIFAGASLDNDEAQGVLHLLGAHRGRPPDTLQQRWGLVVIGSGAGSDTCQPLLPHLRAALQVNADGESHVARSRTLLVTDPRNPLVGLTEELSEDNRFDLPVGVVPRFSALSMPGLLVAALLGVNIMKLLEGARQLSRHFKAAKAGENLVLQFAAWNHVTAVHSAGLPRAWVPWTQALSPTGCWYRQLLSGSLGKQLVLENPLKIGRSRERLDGGSTAPIKPRLIQVAAERFRFDPLPLTQTALELHERKISPRAGGLGSASQANAQETLVDRLHRVYQRTQQALAESCWPTVELLLPQVDEPRMGQLLQLLMLATVVEARLIPCNPFTSDYQ